MSSILQSHHVSSNSVILLSLPKSYSKMHSTGTDITYYFSLFVSWLHPSVVGWLCLGWHAYVVFVHMSESGQAGLSRSFGGAAYLGVPGLLASNSIGWFT